MMLYAKMVFENIVPEAQIARSITGESVNLHDITGILRSEEFPEIRTRRRIVIIRTFPYLRSYIFYQGESLVILRYGRKYPDADPKRGC